MKTCPYCAEEIQDAAIKCRYCQSWLVEEVPPGADTPPTGVAVPEPAPAGQPSTAVPSTGAAATAVPPVAAPSTAAPAGAAPADAPASEQKVEFTHSGERYLLGYTDDFFAIWDRRSPAVPTERFPRTDDGWRQVWQRYVTVEANWMDLRTGQRSP